MDLFTLVKRTMGAVPEFITDGRISPAKNIDTLLRACAVVKQSGQTFRFRIVGAPLTISENEYQKKMVALITELNLSDEVIWEGGVTQTKLAQLLHTADVYIQNGATNSLDKALVQAVATGLPTLSSNQAFSTLAHTHAPTITFPTQNHQALAEKILMALVLSDEGRVEIMKPFTTYVRSEYGIGQLATRIVLKYSSEA
jgi:glycosyltransferase involved in cell wall biosynthesis